MLYTKLQLRNPRTIGEMFNVARKVALAEESAQNLSIKGKEKVDEVPPKKIHTRNFEKKNFGNKNKGAKESFTPLKVTKETLISVY